MKDIQPKPNLVGHRLRGVKVTKDKIRLVYASIEKVTLDSGEEKLEKNYAVSSPYIIPEGMTIADACKVVSYLSEKVERVFNFPPASMQSVAKVSKLLEKYEFKEVPGCVHGFSHATVPYIKGEKAVGVRKSEVHGVIDLFTVGGHMKRFEESAMKQRYFDWYTPGVEKAEVAMIFRRARAYAAEHKDEGIGV